MNGSERMVLRGDRQLSGHVLLVFFALCLLG
jgi:hypothetical protein